MINTPLAADAVLSVTFCAQELHFVCSPAVIPNLEHPLQHKPREGDKSLSLIKLPDIAVLHTCLKGHLRTVKKV